MLQGGLDRDLHRVWYIRGTLTGTLRAWSLITGRGGATKWENRGYDTFRAPPPQDRVKLFAPPPPTLPLLKSGNLLCPTSIWLKLQAISKTCCAHPPFSMGKTLSAPPPFRRGTTSHAPPPLSVICDQSLMMYGTRAAFTQASVSYV